MRSDIDGREIVTHPHSFRVEERPSRDLFKVPSLLRASPFRIRLPKKFAKFLQFVSFGAHIYVQRTM